MHRGWSDMSYATNALIQCGDAVSTSSNYHSRRIKRRETIESDTDYRSTTHTLRCYAEAVLLFKVFWHMVQPRYQLFPTISDEVFIAPYLSYGSTNDEPTAVFNIRGKTRSY
ncbi:hypothetical protein Tcan_00830, partial [Toxocara canis]